MACFPSPLGVNQEVVAGLTRKFQRGEWSGLRELRLVNGEEDITDMHNLMGVVGTSLPDLKVLEVDHMGDEAVRVVLRSLGNGMCTRLEVLTLSDSDFNQEGWTAEELMSFLHHYLPTNTTLRRLTFSECWLSASLMQVIVDTIVDKKLLPHLESLDFSHNPLQDEGVVYLIDALRSSQGKILPALQELHLDEVEIARESADAVVDMLRDSKICPYLKVVNLRSNDVFEEDITESQRRRGGKVEVVCEYEEEGEEEDFEYSDGGDYDDSGDDYEDSDDEEDDDDYWGSYIQ